MDTRLAFITGVLNRGKEQKVFDWDKAARIIKEKKPLIAYAGLLEDWCCTCEDIYHNDAIPERPFGLFLASTWATPVLVLHFSNKPLEEIDCYIMQSKTEWNEKTYWPKSAINILKGE